ncbi:Ig-like domain-containing protein [Agromyces sp. SYSU K20354]|uniref:Ig-like domain-containing protein n=1 Tax=Agromyces cavernae TaxID=2898659 RepID=UPI001E3A91CC|nr:Ig-like domain-containing protein [Agromyces cavernae]MCD2443917.1 Ig-like domain-containing protein [Agromyces cavernae]
MVPLRRLNRHRSAIVTAAAVGAVVAVVGGIAVTSGGYTAQRIELGDAAVWVPNDNIQSIGRANTAALELNSLVETGGGPVEVAQAGSTVLMLDPERASVDIIDVTTSSPTDQPVAVPPDRPTVTIAGAQVVIVSAGDVWTSPIDDFADFDADAEPQLSFGPDALVSVDPSGRLFAYTPTTGAVHAVDTDDAGTIQRSWEITPVTDDRDLQLSSAGGTWAVLDPNARTLTLPGRAELDLAGALPERADPVLQAASADGDEVLVAHERGLIAVGMDDGVVRSLVDGRSGTAVSPVVHEGCIHAAWSRGTIWRSCAPANDRLIELDGASGAAEFEFMANGSALALNDRRSGRTWAASADYEFINNWKDLLDIQSDDEEVEQNDPHEPPTVEKSQLPPVAVDDVEFGARPERSTLLPVILNDYDANGDVLVVDSIEGDLPSWAKVDLVADNQQLQLTLGPEAFGSVSFDYVVTDGRGGTAQAHVEVAVREPEENSPPVQKRETASAVATNGRVTTAVLGDWVDPDGDPFFLEQASIDAPDTVSSTAEGVVVVDEGGERGGSRTVSLLVSDGRDRASGALDVKVFEPGSVPLIADPFVALATAGQEIRIDPLRHVRGGTGTVELSAVPAKPDVELTPDYDRGTVRFTSNSVRTHYLEYSVTDGDETATGVVRVEVSAPPDRDTKPITVPHTAYLRAEQPVDIDVLATDIDPTGGVLVVTAVDPDLESEGVTVEIVEHRLLRVTLTRPLATGSMVFGYRVSNGLAEAEGEVTLVEVPVPAVAQPPVAAPDVISARTGDVVDIPVLANDEHPDAMPITLAPDLVEEPAEGLLFASDDRLRYFAPQRAGEYEAMYRIESAGQFATAKVTISVSEPDPETNVEPVPATVTGRVIAGETVRIPVPLGGVDPDGDSVQLLGQYSNPTRGAVVNTGPDWFEFRAGEYSAGADQFQYSVVDAMGARANGTVRLGIAPRSTGPQKPIAVEDEITVRPGRTISVRVLENDSDPAGGVLTLTGVEPTTGGASAVVVDDWIEVEVPAGEGDYGFIYTIENEQLGQATDFLRVEARNDAPLARPEAADTVLGLSEILGEERIDVPVLRNVFLADGDADALRVGLVPGYARGAAVNPDGTISVDIEDRRRIIPFTVSHPEDASVVGHAFIWVPGRDDALPQLRKDAPRVEVRSGDEVELELADFVIAASGRPVTITDEASVRATHSDGSSLVVDENTLRFRSEEAYFGPASLSFTVTDGSSPDDPEARTGTIVIPIDVLSIENQPPSFVGGVIEFEPGASKTIDLVKLTRYPYPEAEELLEYRVLPPPADGFEVSLDGDEMTITASNGTRTGTRASIGVGVADPRTEGEGGRIELRVVPSTKPIARPVADVHVVTRGTSTSIDVLANDEATNPFPDTPLRLVGRVNGLDADALPRGVTIVPNESGSTLSVTVAADAEPVNTTLQYQVADATDEPSRYAWGTVTISVQDRPDPVTGPQVTGFGDGTLDVAFGAGAFNNSPITGYEIALVGPESGDVLSASTCAATTCTVATPGNGQSNAVVVRVRAQNGIGYSDPVTVPGAIWSDVIPPAPAGLRALPRDGRLRIEWAPVSTGSGSAVRSYVVTVGGVSNEVSAGAACTASVCGADSGSLENGSRVQVSVSARNEAYPALASWTESATTGTPFGPPIAGGITVAGDATAGAVNVSWSPFAANGDTVLGYYVQRLVEGASGVPSGPQSCTVTTPAPGTVVAPSSGGTVTETVPVSPDTTSIRFSGTSSDSTRYSFLVWGYNRAGCVSTDVAGTVVRPGPGAVTDVRSGMDYNGLETWDRYINGVDVSASRMQIVAVDANGAQIPGSNREFHGTGWLRDIFNNPSRFAFGQTARFQVRGCTDWGTCGPWSQVMPSGESPSLTFALGGRAWNSTTNTWSWTTLPNNSGLPATLRCGVEGQQDSRAAQTATSCNVPGARPGDTVWLDIEVAGISTRYTATS